MPPALDRRTFLGATCVGCVAVLAGCGSSSSSGAAPQDASAATTGPGPSAATSGPAPSGATGAPTPVAQLADLVEGQAKAVKVAGKNVLLTRTGPDTVVAFSARCTHEGCTVEPAGQELACPCHGSRYKASDGTVLNGPAPSPLAKVAVSVVNGAVMAG